MKPFIVLISTFIITLFFTRIFKNEYSLALSGRIAISVMLVFTAVAHFTFTEGMEMMIPDLIPFKTEIVYATGILEILAAIGIQVKSIGKLTGWLLILFFICILPTNIYAAIHHIDLQTASFDGHGLNYLWFRIPLQLMFIGWVYFFVVKAFDEKT